MRQFTFADLFCGAGLFSEGFRSLGFRPSFAVDLDQRAVASYNRNVSPVAACGSVSLEIAMPSVDCLIAGPPCQGFSTLGRRDGADERNRLSAYLPTLANASGALIVVVENVPPFLASTHWEKMAAGFVRLGYKVQTMVLDAQDYGAPQRRARAFTIASKLGAIETPLKSSTKTTVSEVLRGIAPSDPLHVWPQPTALALERIKRIPAGGDKRDLMKSAPYLCPASWHALGAQATDVWGRMDANSPSNTLRCRFQNPSTGRYLHPTEDRVISLREGARLQGVPDRWRFEGDRSAVQRQIGNGVPVPLAAAVATSVHAALRLSQSAEAA
ncbi:DNA cytosine methyltransferase [Rhizobium sp. Leaf306]|uniref:DNA cytosine methyltransferase n=1 Tax=Rhizobium sp. Leaf306 TaxID=1736330 RepID=UPI0009ECABB4|nr:DNA cytosine methyltransferase [Rhizobium sp. Leaf306]